MYKIWINTNEDGTINNSYGGYHLYVVAPDEGLYEHYFEVDDFTYKHSTLFKVIGGKLVRI